MAKKKSKPIETEVIEEVIVDEPANEVVEEVIEEVIEEPIEQAQEEVITNNGNQYLFAQMKMINKISNPAKAKRLSERILRNRKR